MRIVISILLSLLLFQSAGPTLLLRLQQSQIRSEMKRAIRTGIPQAELERFVFGADGLLAGGERVEWVEPHEFRYRGVMYDIARSQREGTNTVHWCVRDDDETAVYAQLDRMAREAANGGERGGQADRVLRHLFSPVLPAHTDGEVLAAVSAPLPPTAVPSPLQMERFPADPPPDT